MSINRAEPRDPALAAEFRLVLSAVPTAVAIICAIDDGVPVGVSVGSFGSVSLDPPLVGFFIAASSTTWPSIERTGGFCASVLGADQGDTCRTFATRGIDRFQQCSWSDSPAGRPLIGSSVAWFDCTIVRQVPAGDHSLILGQIDQFDAAADADPLVFVGGRYCRTIPATDKEGW